MTFIGSGFLSAGFFQVLSHPILAGDSGRRPLRSSLPQWADVSPSGRVL